MTPEEHQAMRQAGDRFVLAFLALWGIALWIAQAWLIMLGHYAPWAGMLGTYALGCVAYAHGRRSL